MTEQTDKTRVIRLVKKAQVASTSPPAQAPQESPSPERPKSDPRPPRRFDRVKPQLERPSWKNKPFRKRQGPPASRDRRPPKSVPPPKPIPIVLTEEQKARILELYRDMVMKGERPAEGRRNKIAEMLSIPYAKVAEVVRGYVTHERYRRTNFDIEKRYWQAVRSGETNAQVIAKTIADQLRVDEGRVWWWLEKLHEPRKSFAQDPELEESKRDTILAFYEAYLEQTDPPEKGLHLWMAEQVGDLTPRQVHKVLWTYRFNAWQALEGTERKPASEPQPPEPTE